MREGADDRFDGGRWQGVGNAGARCEPPQAAGRAERRSRRAAGVKLTGQEWVVALLIGLATVTAAMFGWRAAQIGSTAAFDDRQSIGSTIAVQQAQIEVDLGAAVDAADYVRYLGDYAVAAELEGSAPPGDAGAAARAQAADLRRGATLRAAEEGVFGASTITDDIRDPSRTPRVFDFDAKRAALAADLSTRLESGGSRNPQASADAAGAIRDRIYGLVRWAFVIFVAVLMFTIAQVWRKTPRIFYGFAAAGLLGFLIGAIGGLSYDFFGSSL
jgi:hypothetical protein